MDSNKTKKTKLIATIAIIIIIVVVILYVSVPFFMDETQSGEYSMPEITLLTTASDVSINPTNYNSSIYFIIGDKVWIYQEHTNTSHNGASDYHLSLSVIHSNGDRLGFVEEYIDTDKNACFYSFNTNETWSTGLYLVYSKLIDNISNKTATDYTNFYLSDGTV
jgi:hypothetical protein